MAQMQDYGADTQEDAFTYLAELTKSIRSFSQGPPKAGSPSDPEEDGWSGSILGIYANSIEVVVDMMDTFSSLVKNYLFTEEQISDMASDISVLDNENQRTYLEITETGLNTLLRKDED